MTAVDLMLAAYHAPAWLGPTLVVAGLGAAAWLRWSR
jgi:hypothetical protein